MSGDPNLFLNLSKPGKGLARAPTETSIQRGLGARIYVDIPKQCARKTHTEPSIQARCKSWRASDHLLYP